MDKKVTSRAGKETSGNQSYRKESSPKDATQEKPKHFLSPNTHKRNRPLHDKFNKEDALTTRLVQESKAS
jgi:hypothetical protein